MDSFNTWVLRTIRDKYADMNPNNRLLRISALIDWIPIRNQLESQYNNKIEKGGRPNCDVIVMFKILLLQQWYGLSDLEAERQIADRLSFMEFLGYPDPIPDSRTIWLFREGLKVKRGTVQDATFIEADPGSSKKPRGNEAKTDDSCCVCL